MSYQDFTLEMLRRQYGLKSQTTTLFENLRPLAASDLLIATLKRNQLITLASEKARSESLVFPILIELVANNEGVFTFFSGDKFEVDKANGLTGFCDFLLSNTPKTYAIEAPVFALVEAKKGIVEGALGQCAAEMLAARLYNEQQKHPYPIIYGCATSGMEWLFLKLEGNTIWIDEVRYFLKTELDSILGVLQEIVDFYKAHKTENQAK